MNVTAVSSDRTPLYAFFITAIALIVGVLCIWAGSSIFMRYHKLRQDLHQKLNYGQSQKLHFDAIMWSRQVRAATISLWTRQDPPKIMKDLAERSAAAHRKRYAIGLERQLRREAQELSEPGFQTSENDHSAAGQRDESAV